MHNARNMNINAMYIYTSICHPHHPFTPTNFSLFLSLSRYFSHSNSHFICALASSIRSTPKHIPMHKHTHMRKLHNSMHATICTQKHAHKRANALQTKGEHAMYSDFLIIIKSIFLQLLGVVVRTEVSYYHTHTKSTRFDFYAPND